MLKNFIMLIKIQFIKFKKKFITGAVGHERETVVFLKLTIKISNE